MQQPHPFELARIAQQIWQNKYCFSGSSACPADDDMSGTWRRVAHAVASAETGSKATKASWARRFEDLLAEFTFLPAGRIIAGAGTGRSVTLFNCFVMNRIEDDMSAIFDGVKEAALTMQQGGGIGHDFSTLRPAGAPVKSIGADASGPVSFMQVWDSMCQTIMSAGARRGAMMGTMRCDHPDIEAFIDAKSQQGQLKNFNLSVLITDNFITAVRKDLSWDLIFEGKIYRSLPARRLWDRIMRATYDYAEPGVIFIDRINASNNLAYCETIDCTNPCGEQPLPPNGACLLGSINLPRLISTPFHETADLHTARLEDAVHTAVRFLDNVITISKYPLSAQKAEALAKRRIGLGVTGLADALVMCGLRYGEPKALERAQKWMQAIQHTAYLASSELAREKGNFPLFDRAQYVRRPNVQILGNDIIQAIERNGIRNGCLTSIAPTGTISLLAGNVSSGIEPIFALNYERRVLEPNGTHRTEQVNDYAFELYRRKFGEDTQLPSTFETVESLPPQAHIAMQAAVQPFVDSAISKTVNCPTDISFNDFKSVYLDAYDKGLKGCTTYRPNDIRGAVLIPESQTSPRAENDGTEEEAHTAEIGEIQTLKNPADYISNGTPTQSSEAQMEPMQNSDCDIIMLTRPLKRDQALPGYTYKLKWPNSPDAIYVTINDIEHNGHRRPFEIFINTKNLEHYAWTVALTRMISAVFRRGGDVTFVVEELKAIFDPQGGRWLEGRYVPSLQAAIGNIIEAHMRRTGFLREQKKRSKKASIQKQTHQFSAHVPATKWQAEDTEMPRSALSTPKRCPQCSASELIRTEGCWNCRMCGYSQCG